MDKAKRKLLNTKTIKLRGIKFVYKALLPVDFVGVPENPFMNYRDIKDINNDRLQEERIKKNPAQFIEKLKKHYTAIFMKAIVGPHITISESKDNICVDDLLKDMDLANKLYEAIVDNCVKKKNLFISMLQKLKTLISWPKDTVSSLTK